MTDPFLREQLVEIINTRDGTSVEPDNDVPGEQSGFSGRTVSLVRDDHNTALNRQAVIVNDAAWNGNVLSRQTNIAAADLAVANQPTGHELRGVNRGGEANSLCRQNHCRVDADHDALRVDQRTAGVAGIERRVSLD